MGVLITGSSGYVGTELCRRYESNASVQEVIGLDIVPPRESFSKLAFYQQDCNGDLTDVFRSHQIQTVIHLVFVLNPIHDSTRMYDVNVGSLENILTFIKRYGVKRLLVTSSATAYGAHPDNPKWITEDFPLRGNPDFQYARDKTIVEERLASFMDSHPEVEVVVARPAIVCGPHIGNFISRYVSKRIVPLVKDSGVEMQFLHEEDVAEGLFRLATEARPGVYNLGPPDTIRPEEVVEALGGTSIGLGPRFIRFLTGLAWSLRLKSLTEAPKSMIDFIQFRWVVDGSKIEQETNFRYRHTSADAIRSFAEATRGV